MPVAARAPRTRSASAGSLDARSRHHDDELLAAPAGAQVAGPRVLADDGAERRERAVARRVAALVVDGLEVVDVEGDDRDPGAVARRPRGLDGEALLEAAT